MDTVINIILIIYQIIYYLLSQIHLTSIMYNADKLLIKPW